jgi:hypothetical protein
VGFAVHDATSETVSARGSAYGLIGAGATIIFIAEQETDMMRQPCAWRQWPLNVTGLKIAALAAAIAVGQNAAGCSGSIPGPSDARPVTEQPASVRPRDLRPVGVQPFGYTSRPRLRSTFGTVLIDLDTMEVPATYYYKYEPYQPTAESPSYEKWTGMSRFSEHVRFDSCIVADTILANGSKVLAIVGMRHSGTTTGNGDRLTLELVLDPFTMSITSATYRRVTETRAENGNHSGIRRESRTINLGLLRQPYQKMGQVIRSTTSAALAIQQGGNLDYRQTIDESDDARKYNEGTATIMIHGAASPAPNGTITLTITTGR